MMDSTQPAIVSLGEPLLEFNQDKQDGRYLTGHGGDTSNAAIAAARAGAHVGYLTRLGADEFGDSFMQLWESEGVDASYVQRDPVAHTGIYFVTHGPTGHSFSYYRTGSAASRIAPDDIPKDYVAGAQVLHVSGISQAISDSAADAVFRAIDIANANNTLVSYDTNLRLKLWPLARARAVIHAAMKQCDIALPGLDDARQLTGHEDPDAIADYYLDLGADIVALTLGPAGSLVATREDRRLVPGIDVSPVDATAAGDTFDGAFLAEYLNTRDPVAAARFANAAAALSTTGYGAVAPMPHRDQVLEAIASGQTGIELVEADQGI
jgi:2-dehydro-3-deoxygluconokinase